MAAPGPLPACPPTRTARVLIQATTQPAVITTRQLAELVWGAGVKGAHAKGRALITVLGLPARRLGAGWVVSRKAAELAIDSFLQPLHQEPRHVTRSARDRREHRRIGDALRFIADHA